MLKQIFKSIVKILMTIFFIGLIIAIVSFVFYARTAPTITLAQLQGGGASKLYDQNGNYISTIGANQRKYIKYSQIPTKTKDAIISIEDKRFYSEKLGIDPLRIIKSTITNLTGNNLVGGSTITQQLVKLSVFSTDQADRTIKRKIQEAWLASQISKKYTKNQILEYYINKVYMNYNVYGLETAAEKFYHKKLAQLDLAQTALLAGMPNSPISYDPYVYPQKAMYRRNTVLKAMLDNKKISQKQFIQASNESITTGLQRRIVNQSQTRRQHINDPYIKEVIHEVKQTGYNPYTDNLKITVNLDQGVQKKLYELANDGDIKFTNNKMQVAVTVLDAYNGHVLAMLGGRKLPNVQLALNRAVQTDRSSGSSIGPILDYAPGIEYENWSTTKVLQDTPYTYKGSNIQLHDWDDKYLGAMNIRYALEQSRNVPAIRVLESIGLNKACKFVKNMGISIPESRGLSVGIGAYVSTLQLAGAYGSFATEGIYHRPQLVSKIETVDGKIINLDSNGLRVMKPSTAYIITDILKGVISTGSGTAAKIKNIYQAGKTGTVKYSEEELRRYPQYAGSPKDSWFVGYTPRYVIAVWTGYDKLQDGKIDAIGELSAQQIYKKLMSYLLESTQNTDWIKPSSVVAIKLGNRTELFVKGHVPNEVAQQQQKQGETQQTVIQYYYYVTPAPNSQEASDQSNLEGDSTGNDNDSTQ